MLFTMYNFSCLMNNAYRDNEKPHVHFWFVPRYKHELNIFNKIYIDKHFGYLGNVRIANLKGKKIFLLKMKD